MTDGKVNISSIAPEKPEQRTSKFMKVAYICFAMLIPLIFCIMLSEKHSESLILEVVALVFGLAWLASPLLAIMALLQINLCNGTVKGKRGAGLFMVLFMFMFLAVAMPALGKLSVLAMKRVCSENIRAISTALQDYASKHDGQLPSAEDWCDTLMTEENVGLVSFVCPSSDFRRGESSYSINTNAAGAKLSDLSKDMVILFELTTDSSYEDDRIRIPLSSRGFAQRNGWSGDRKYFDNKVRKDYWNQTGGLEQATSANHWSTESGSNILFADGRINFILESNLSKLQWDINSTAETDSFFMNLARTHNVRIISVLSFGAIIIVIGIYIAIRNNIASHWMFATVLSVFSGATGAFFGTGAELFYIFSWDGQQGAIAGGIIGVVVAVSYAAILSNRRDRFTEQCYLRGYALALGMATGIICSTLVHLALLILSDDKNISGILLGLPCGFIAGLVLGAISGNVISIRKTTNQELCNE